MKICQNCGTPANDNDKFCMRCGSDKIVTNEPSEKVFLDEERSGNTLNCIKCGAALNPGDKFCMNCGFENKASAQPQFRPAGHPSSFGTNQKYSTYSNLRDMHDLKSRCASALFKAFAICYSLLVLMFLILAFSKPWYLTNNTYIEISFLLNHYNSFDLIFSDLLNTRPLAVLSSLTFVVPFGFICFSIWKTHIASADRSTNGMDTKGINIAKIVFKVMFICGLVWTGAFVIKAVMIIITTTYPINVYFEILPFVFALAYLVLNSIFYKKVSDFLNDIQNSVQTGYYKNNFKAPTFIIVWNIIICVKCLIQLINYARYDFFGSVVPFVEIAVLVLIEIILINFNNRNKVPQTQNTSYNQQR